MFGTLGGPELFLIMVVALIVFGPKKLPEIGKSLGRMMNEFKKASSEFRQTLEDEVEADKRRETAQLAAPVTVTASVIEPLAAHDPQAIEHETIPAPAHDAAVASTHEATPPSVAAPAEPTVSRELEPK